MIVPQIRSSPDRRLLGHLLLLLALKVLLLYVLWRMFVDPYRVAVDSAAMEQRLTAPLSTVEEKPSHDR